MTEQTLPGVYHLAADMGVRVTLLVGAQRALLVDTGYGLGGLPDTIRGITDLPLVVINTHGHHDHALGNWQFDAVRMHPADKQRWQETISQPCRQRVLNGALSQNALPQGFDEEAYLTRVYPEPLPLEDCEIELGGLTAHVLHTPGHTEGSVVVHVPQAGLMIMGDNWNPVTWMFLPGCTGLKAYKEQLQKLLLLPFEHVLVSHCGRLCARAQLEAYVDSLTPEVLQAAVPVTIRPYERFDTRQCSLPCGTVLVFDHLKNDLDNTKSHLKSI